ncbi:MAG: hypothetical protein IKS49_05505 [Actinomycetaceae bacterium]|nr:hypothetical protein [Actinomycetaceae bacterium]
MFRLRSFVVMAALVASFSILVGGVFQVSPAVAEETSLSTKLKLVDEAGSSLTFDDVTVFGSEGERKPEGGLYRYAPEESLTIFKPGYLIEEVSSLVPDGETTVVLKKAPLRDVTFKYVDALSGEELTGVTGMEVYLRGESYPVSNDGVVTLPDYSDDPNDVNPNSADLVWRDNPGWYAISLAEKENVVEILTVHVRVIDEKGNPVPGAEVTFKSDFVSFNSSKVLETYSDVKTENTKDQDIVFYYMLTTPDDSEAGSNRSLVSIDVQAPEGYEKPAPVGTFIHGKPYDSSVSVLNDRVTADDRVEYVSKEVKDADSGETRTKYQGEVVTIVLKKKPVDPTPNAEPSSTATSVAATANTSLANTGTSVGVTGMAALFLVGLGVLLRRRVNQ